MSETPLVYPAYYRVVRREIKDVGYWHFRKCEVFYNPSRLTLDFDKAEEHYGTTKSKVIIELFRINGGRVGYYLANLRDKQYYYCGEKEADVRIKLQSLGIGTHDPLR